MTLNKKNDKLFLCFFFISNLNFSVYYFLFTHSKKRLSSVYYGRLWKQNFEMILENSLRLKLTKNGQGGPKKIKASCTLRKKEGREKYIYILIISYPF